MNRLLFLPAVLVTAALAACESATPPVYGYGDLAAARADYTAANALPATAPADLPDIGSATYRGMIASRVGNDYDGDMVGDIRMDVGFDLAGDVSGAITNVTLLGVDNVRGSDPDFPDQTLDGSLAINGNRIGNDITANASGRLVAVNDIGAIRRFDTNLGLAGTIRSDGRPYDTITGNFGGNAENTNDPDDDLGLFNGVFHATR